MEAGKFTLDHWTPEAYGALMEQVASMAEEEYRCFQGKLLPPDTPFLGVRLPKLRRLSREILRGNAAEYFSYTGNRMHEEVLLEGMVLGGLQEPVDVLWNRVESYLPKVTNWALCDSFCAGLKIAAACREAIRPRLRPLWLSGREFSIRFALVLLLWYYKEETDLPLIFQAVEEADLSFYYAQMGAAWLLSLCYIRFPEPTEAFFDRGTLEWRITRKTYQKILESNQADEAMKAYIRRRKERGR